LREQLQLLVELQAVDKTLYDLEQELKVIPQSLDESEQAQKALEQSLGQAEAELAEVVRQRRDLEKANEGIRARTRRAENRLMGSKTQREYRAATAEIEEGKDALKGNDDALLELMERQESLEAAVKKLSAEFAQASAQAKERKKILTARAAELTKETNRLQKSRQGLVKDVDSELMGHYDFIRERKQGVALAPVKAGTCLACHMQLPAQQFNELLRMDKVMNCPSCNRLMYLAEAEQPEKSS